MTALNDIAPVVAGAQWHHDGFWWLPFTLLWLLVLGTAIWFLVRTLRRREPSNLDHARAILAERYARGEVSVEEYRERLDELGRTA